MVGGLGSTSVVRLKKTWKAVSRSRKVAFCLFREKKNIYFLFTKGNLGKDSCYNVASKVVCKLSAMHQICARSSHSLPWRVHAGYGVFGRWKPRLSQSDFFFFVVVVLFWGFVFVDTHNRIFRRTSIFTSADC